MATTSYADPAFAESYFSERLDADAWDDASTTTQLKALKQATREMDVFEYAGFKTDAEQPNEFPREGDTDVPIEVQQACCEVAIALLEGQTLSKAFKKQGITSEGVGDASVSYGESGGAAGFEASGNLPSMQAYRLLREFLADQSEFEILRTG